MRSTNVVRSGLAPSDQVRPSSAGQETSASGFGAKGARGPSSGREYRPDGDDEKRFWLLVDRSQGVGACWPWKGSRVNGGYGQFRTASSRIMPVRAHRIAYGLAHGYVPSGLSVMHLCDNPPCCNPAHLALGTHAENMRDMARKGRYGDTSIEVCKRGHHKGRKRACVACRRVRNLEKTQRRQHSIDQVLDAQRVAVQRFAATFAELTSRIGDDREAIVLADYFGLYGRSISTLDQIGARLGVTREWARRLRNRGLGVLGIGVADVMRERGSRFRCRAV